MITVALPYPEPEMAGRQQVAMKIHFKFICLIAVLFIDAMLASYAWSMAAEGIVFSQQVSADESEGEGKLVALTFDDGPDAAYTPRLLDGLRERGVHASFFLIGKSIKGNEDIVRQMQADGHLIGNHSYTHVQLTKETDERACEEIEKTNQAIYDVTGEMPAYIRPPFGSWNDDLECSVPMTVVLWNIDPLDWQVKNSQKVVHHVLKKVKNNSIILLHDSYASSVDAALEIVDTLTRQGYTFVTVDELLID